MNKCFFIVVFCTFVNVAAFPDEVLFKPIKDSVYYYDHDHFDRILGSVPDGLYKGDMFLAKTMYIILDGDGVSVKPEDFQSVNTKDVFPPELIRNREDENQKTWWPAFYFEALQKKDRTIIFETEKDRIYRYKIWDAWYNFSESEVPEKWHIYYLLEEGIEFYQHGLRVFEFGLFIDSVEKTETGFVVTVLGDRTYNYEKLKHTFIPWPADGKDHFFKLIMEFDGDFLTVYLNSRSTVFLELVRVDKTMVDLLYGVIKGEQVIFNDTTPWPRRADGSIDYPLPQLAQATIPEQPKTITIDTSAEYEDAAAVTHAGETIAQQPGIGLPLIIVLATAGAAVICGVVVFLIRRKR
jgi:hypothetical protein